MQKGPAHQGEQDLFYFKIFQKFFHNLLAKLKQLNSYSPTYYSLLFPLFLVEWMNLSKIVI